jgi:hypothetical protein
VTLIFVFANDEFKKSDGAIVTHLNGQAVSPGEEIAFNESRLTLTDKGTPSSLNWQLGSAWHGCICKRQRWPETIF